MTGLTTVVAQTLSLLAVVGDVAGLTALVTRSWEHDSMIFFGQMEKFAKTISEILHIILCIGGGGTQKLFLF